MKILVVGADGMLGHQVVESLRDRHEVAGTVRHAAGRYLGLAHWLPAALFDRVDVRQFDRVESVIAEFEPDAVVNAAGIVKQRSEAKEAIESIEVNALLPHRLAEVCVRRGIRMVHFSTDCVFSGATGSYGDDALHDARDLYGRSKSMGEVAAQGVVTLRTSIVGLELNRKASLIEWFLAQTAPIRGFRRAIYTGFTTLEMARIVERLLMLPSPASGIFNVSSDAIDKCTLLQELKTRLGRSIEIAPDDSFVCDRSMDSIRFRERFGYRPPTWADMLEELAAQVRDRYPGVVR